MHPAVQIAALSNRTLVWPDMPCTAPLVGRMEGGELQIRTTGVWLAYGTRQTHLRCTLM